MIRYLLTIFPIATSFFTPVVLTICLIAIIYTSLACLSQIDLKKYIAYSSIAHMGTATLGLFSNTVIGIVGGLFFLISHGLIAGALFLLIGVLYDRYHTRNITYYRGLVSIMPIFVTLYLFFSMANAAIPGTSGFISEFLTLTGTFQSNPLVAIIACLAIVLTPAYSLWFFHKVSYGSFSPYLPTIFPDLTKKEFNMFMPLIFFTLLLGLNSSFLTEYILLTSMSLSAIGQ